MVADVRFKDMTEKELKNRLLLAGLVAFVITVVGLLVWTRLFGGDRKLAGSLFTAIVFSIGFVGYGIFTVHGFLQDRRVPKESPPAKPEDLLSDRTCPACGTRLHRNQVDNMIGNPSYQEWCREGFCSLKCFQQQGEPNQASQPIAAGAAQAER
jgi:hypothetical protein